MLNHIFSPFPDDYHINIFYFKENISFKSPSLPLLFLSYPPSPPLSTPLTLPPSPSYPLSSSPSLFLTPSLLPFSPPSASPLPTLLSLPLYFPSFLIFSLYPPSLSLPSSLSLSLTSLRSPSFFLDASSL